MISAPQYRPQTLFGLALGLTFCVLGAGCHSTPAPVKPSIEFTHVPSEGDGSPDKLERIEGRIHGALPGERVVLFALSGVWWVQPLADQPFTTIQSDSTWKSVTHPGTAYAALLVDSRYSPPLTMNTLPQQGGPVVAETIAAGTASSKGSTLQFSGYQWDVRENAGDHGGSMNFYTPKNAWTDENGFLHLRASRSKEGWVSAEVKQSRSLGYGSYRFVVREISQLEPAAVFALFTWDDRGPPREMDIEISRWGEPEDKNAQFVVQPYVVPANTVRFEAPLGTLTYLMDWRPGRVSFKSIRGAAPANLSAVVAEHVFTSGVPSAGSERIHMNVYVYSNKRHPMENEFETIIEKFEYLP